MPTPPRLLHRLWDIGTGQLNATQRSLETDDEPPFLSLLPHRVWDMATGAPLAVLEGEEAKKQQALAMSWALKVWWHAFNAVLHLALMVVLVLRLPIEAIEHLPKCEVALSCFA